MDNQRNSLLNWAFFCQGKSMEELRYSLLYTSLELEQTRLLAQDELRKKDDQLIHLKDLLCKIVRERDEAVEKCQRLLLEKFMLLQQQQNAPLSGISSIEDEPRRAIDSNNGFSSSDCEESIVSSPVVDPIPPPPPSTTIETMVVPKKPLPEKGKLLQAVMKAGPLLQTLLLAGPLPQWRHPPPPLDSVEIPPVTVPSPPHLLQQNSLTNTNNNACNKKRPLVSVSDGSYSPIETKHQKILLH